MNSNAKHTVPGPYQGLTNGLFYSQIPFPARLVPITAYGEKKTQIGAVLTENHPIASKGQLAPARPLPNAAFLVAPCLCHLPPIFLDRTGWAIMAQCKCHLFSEMFLTLCPTRLQERVPSYLLPCFLLLLLLQLVREQGGG